mgnify:CR=1 FL=1
MAKRIDYRTDLIDKLVGLEDEGYGDFEFTTAELNTYLALATARLYPAVYTTTKIADKTVVAYGSVQLGAVATTFASKVYLVEDVTERDTVVGWKVRPGEIINIDSAIHPTVHLYYHDAYALAADDTTDLGLGAAYRPLLVLGSLIEALESRHDTGVRGEPQPTGPHQEVPLIDRLTARYDRLKEEMAMSLPGVVM